MQTRGIRGRRLRFTAVLAMVVLTLTGFSTGRHHSRHGSSGGGGGGCSSSRQDHDSSSSTSGGTSGGSSGGSYGSGPSDDDSYGSSSGGSSGGRTYTRRPTHRPTATSSSGTGKSALRDGTAKLLSCATKKQPYATVEVTNPNDRKATFSTTVYFMGDVTAALDHDTVEVSVPARGSKTVKVAFDPANTDLLDHCEVDAKAPPAS